MIQLAYTSTAAQSLGAADVFKIIETSARKNADAKLTGFLIYANRQFFQVVEGPHKAIDELMERLKHDPRHHSLHVVHRAAIPARSFAKWSMKRVAWPDHNARLTEIVPELTNAPPMVQKAAQEFVNFAAG